jgi:D-arabinose 1-dehydrogenase-like Zn-dependent alcohol dehydrogenase
MGADVTVVTTSPDKEEDARRFGAKDVLINKEGADFSKYKRVFDFVLDTIPYEHDLDRFIPLLKRDATLCRVGVGKLTTPNEYGQMTTVLSRTALPNQTLVAFERLRRCWISPLSKRSNRRSQRSRWMESTTRGRRLLRNKPGIASLWTWI